MMKAKATGYGGPWLVLLMIWVVASCAVLSAGPAFGPFQGQEQGQEEQEGQEGEEKKEETPPLYKVKTPGLKFRSIGPALTAGRIADFAVNPDNPAQYYVAVASGGVWKTDNKGITFEPIFDGQGSYSIGCVSLDPNNHHVVWVGTGENNNQRSVPYGDGVYKSLDGGKSWKHMGLKESEHIGMIAIDPRDSSVVYVAAYGPLWSAGGDRGLYKSTDGGQNWEKVLEISENTGVSEVHLDPRNPDLIYAVAHQRRRHVFTLIDGGPESAVYKSEDAGTNWRKIMKGLPGGHVGRIGMDISPANPDVLYAIVEAQGRRGGFFRSTNRGETWSRRSSYTSRGNYYQEIFADPADVDRVYSMDTFGQVTDDGGATWERYGGRNRHVDDHALWIDPDNPDYLLNGNDGGIYESYDRGRNWRFMTQLPITQFYKVEVDNAEPFYNVYGGTQDNYSLGGPSRTTSRNGIENADWFVTKGGDGFETQVDPEDPNIIYAQSQYGSLARFDRRSGESIAIQPQEGEGENAYIWNWDSPLLISPHSKTRLYFAADKVFRSDDQGESWTAVSGDLTRQIDRNTLDVMGQTWPMDAVAKHASTSTYGNIVALEESARIEGLLYAGTDDGLIHVTGDGGGEWTRHETFPGVPDMTYVNEVLPSRHDDDTVYAAFNNHKRGDFKPYVLKSTDRGASWTSIASNLPERGSVYALAEDPVNPDLLFAGTEFGVFYTLDGGQYWKQFKAGLPTIAVRDIAIQEREDDLVLGTFGRSFYVLDNYSALRDLSQDVIDQEGHLFEVSDALMFIPYSRVGGGGKGFQGENFFVTPNPDVGAKITFYFKETIKTLEQKREEEESKKFKEKEVIEYPSYEEMRAEEEEEEPFLLLTITDAQGNEVRRLRHAAREGVQRINWDLRFPDTSEADSDAADPGEDVDSGILVLPGTYNVTLSKSVNGEVTQVAGPQSFEVRLLGDRTFPPSDPEAMLAFNQRLLELNRAITGARRAVGDLGNKLELMRGALKAVEPYPQGVDDQLDDLEDRLDSVRRTLFGDSTRRRLDQDQPPSLFSRVNSTLFAGFRSISDPTGTQERVYQIIEQEFDPVITEINDMLTNAVPALEQRLSDLGAPWTPGRTIDWRK
ncbi:MAG TPA: glycosyl hydrolase [Acidobacteriota bacterium]|nr:glycosyl hydrolase [Acidobacteriota bacterium]